MVKQSWDYESKGAARKMFRNFILSHKKDLGVDLEDAKVVCLPGYDEKSGTSLEIEQVYDKIGVKRSNIVGIEEDKEIYEKLKDAKLGIELKPMNDTNFFWNNKEKFDIVSLDYCGTLNNHAAWSLICAFAKGLNGESILHTNFLAKRDSESEKIYDELSELNLKILPIIAKDEPDYLRSELSKRYTKKIEEELREKRSDGITKYIIDTGRDYPIKAAGIPGTFVMDKEFKLSDFTPEGWKNGIWWKYNERLVDELRVQYDALTASIINTFLMQREYGPFFCEDLERYEYQNPVGTRMYGDLFFFKQHPEWYDEKKYPISMRKNLSGNREIVIGNETKAGYTSLEMDNYGHNKVIIDNGRKENILEKKCINQAIFINGAICAKSKNIPRRTILSTPKNPKAENSNILNELLRDELLSGTPEVELYEKFPGLNPRKVAAIKAHITMGTYESK